MAKTSTLLVQQSDEFWQDLSTRLSALDLPPRWKAFEERIRNSCDLNEIYDTDDFQKVKAFGHYPGLSAKPIYDVTRFNFTTVLEAASEDIRVELEKFLEDAKEETEENRIGRVDHNLGCSEDTWSTQFFNGSYGESFNGIALIRNGEKMSHISPSFPRTLSLLDEHGIAGGNRLVFFARQKAESGIPPHSDCVNYLLTGHLGVVVPSSVVNSAPCGMSVGGSVYKWEKGKLIIFQNSFPHFTWNESNHDRILLYFDFWHPDLLEEERTALTIFERTRREHEERASQAAQAINPALEELLKRVHRQV